MKYKWFISLLLSLLLLSFPFFYSFAETFNVYGSVTQSTTQISNLLDTLQNQNDFDPFMPWVGMRTGEYDYSIFFNIKDNGSCQRIRYYAISSGYNQTWYFERSTINQLYYNSNNYTVVGSQYNQLGSSKINDAKHNYVFMYTVPFILVVLLFFVFRIRKRSGHGGVTIR